MGGSVLDTYVHHSSIGLHCGLIVSYDCVLKASFIELTNNNNIQIQYNPNQNLHLG